MCQHTYLKVFNRVCRPHAILDPETTVVLKKVSGLLVEKDLQRYQYCLCGGQRVEELLYSAFDRYLARTELLHRLLEHPLLQNGETLKNRPLFQNNVRGFFYRGLATTAF